MKSFLNFISEEVLPTAMVQDGNFDLRNEMVRDQINTILSGICSHSHITPYITLRKVSKALAYFSIILPKKTFLEGKKGVEVYEMMQFGNKIGMNDEGEFINEVPEKYFLFFQFNQFGGMFGCIARVVDKAELDKMLDMAEVTMKEDCSDDMATASQHNAGKEPIQPESPSTKKAKDVSEKGLKAKAVNEALKGNQYKIDANKNNKIDSQDFKLLRAKKKMDEEQIDEISKKLAGHYLGQAGYDRERARGEAEVHVNSKKKHERDWAQNQYMKTHRRGKGAHLAISKLVGYAKVPATEETINEISHKLALRAMKKSEKRGNQEYERDMTDDRLSDPDTHYDRAQRLRGHMRKKFGNDKPGRGNTGIDPLGPDKRGYGIGREKSDRLTHGKRAGLPSRRHITNLKSNIKLFRGKHKKANLPEETQIDEVSAGLAVRATHHAYVKSDQMKKDAQKEPDMHSYVQAVHKAEKKSKQGVKFAQYAAKKMKEETQLDEISKGLVKRYKKAAESDKRSAESSAETSHAHRKNRALPLAKRNAFHDEEKWLKGIAKKREKGIAMADKRLEEGFGGVKKDTGYRSLHRKMSTVVRSGLQGNAESQTIRVTRKGDPSNKIIRISKNKFDPARYNKV